MAKLSNNTLDYLQKWIIFLMWLLVSTEQKQGCHKTENIKCEPHRGVNNGITLDAVSFRGSTCSSVETRNRSGVTKKRLKGIQQQDGRGET